MSSSSIPISKTKIIVPNRRPELLSRARLLESLKKHLENKLVLLSASAGYGKTSLLIDLAHNVNMPVCWLSLDVLDRDPQRFISYLVASFEQRFPGVGESSQNLLSNLKSIETESESLLVTLTNDLYERVEEDYLLIIDDFHLLDDVPVISSLINRFLQLVDENCHLIISSRTLPELDDVTLMVAREQVTGLNHIELAFQPREIQALYAQNHHEHLSDERASEIVGKTGGWITGMVLSKSPGMQVSGADMFAYLGRQVLDQLPQHIREFLLRTSLPEEFNAEFCEIVLSPFHAESQNWLDLMAWIMDKNLFVLPLEDGRWLRYHPLFREFLQTRLKRERPQEIQPMLERMVKAYEAVGEWEKAYFTCKQLNDPDALAGLIERAGTPMLQTALVTLEGWINSLPPATVRSRPGLISLRGAISAMKGNLPEANALLDMAIEMLGKEGNNKGLALALVRRAQTLRLLGKYVDSMNDINRALQMVEEDHALQPLYAESIRIRGLTSFRLGQSRSAVNDLERSLALYTELKETKSIPVLLAETAMIHATIGDVESARTLYQESLKWLHADKNMFSQADTLNNLAVLYLQLGEYELASNTFEEGLDRARRSRNQHAELLILAGLGDLYAEVEEFDAAKQAYDRAEDLTNEGSSSFLANYLTLARANLLLLQNDTNTASEILRQFKRKLKINPSTYELGFWSFLEGKRNLLDHQPNKAIRLLKEGKTCFFQDGRDAEFQWCVIWLMIAHDQAGERENAILEFQELLGAKNKVSHPLIIALHQAANWLASLQQYIEIEKDLSNLIEKSQLLSATMSSVRRALRRLAQSIEMPTASLKIRALGRGEVIINGRALNISDWRSQSARDLFFFFLSQQNALTKEQIGQELLRDVDDEHVIKTRFKQDIYRLRKAVGRNTIVFEDENYRFNRDIDYEYDVEAFGSYLQRARRDDDSMERIGYYRRALSLYDGPYLSDVDDDWVLIERQRLQLSYLSALEDLARLYLETNQLVECLNTCKQVIAQDQYNEIACQLEMRVYAAQGDRATVTRKFNEYKAKVENDLGLPPSEETETVYRELIS